MKYLLLLILLVPLPSLAAFEIQRTSGQETSRIVVFLLATTTSINAVEGTLVVPEGATVSSVYTGSSVITSWVELPRISGNTIRFAGIIPGGFTGSVRAGEGLTGSSELFSFEISGSGPFIMTNAYQYLNDGIGTRVAVPSFEVTPREVPGTTSQEDDRIPPEYVEATLDRTLVEGRVALLIDAYDARSGIDRFEVQEGNGEWVRSMAAYVIEDESGLKPISVRAYDGAGNFIETRVEGVNAGYAKLAFVAVVLIIILIGATVALYFKKLRKRS